MADQFLGEIRIFGGNFAPNGWALCNGQLLTIAQNTALFSLLGTNFGGDGRSNFGLPNLQGNAPIFWQQGPGTSNYYLGESGGQGSVTLNASQMAAHDHPAGCDTNAGTTANPVGGIWASEGGRGKPSAYSSAAPTTPMSPAAVGGAGGNQPHNNLSPYLVLNFIIAPPGDLPAPAMSAGVPAPAGPPMSEPVTLRPIRHDDAAFLFEVYASTRAEELSVLDWGAEQSRAFLRMQFDLQHRYYQDTYPGAAYQLILRGGRPAGRLYVDRRDDALHILDIALLPADRGAGLGGALLGALQAEAAAAGRPVRIFVERTNRALRLYDRLGFRAIGDHGIYLQMEWSPDRPAPPPARMPDAS